MIKHRPAYSMALILLVILALGVGGSAAQEDSNNPDVFTIGAFGYTSNYPDGMTFTLEASSSAGAITRATVFFDFGAEQTSRVQATEINNDDGILTADLLRLEYGGGLIPWLDVNYYWRLVDAEGNAYETGIQHEVYEDPTREWMSAENDMVRVYWFGLPEWVGEEALDAVDEARDRWELGFPGVELEPPPLVVIYPDLESFLEWRGETGADSLRFVGTLRPEWNGVVQRVPDQARLDRECGGLDYEEDFEQAVRVVARGVVTHELTHFHQFETNVDRGPLWWVEGQPTFFEDEYQSYDANARIAELALMGELPSLRDGNLSGAGTIAVDGCSHLGYDVGAVFLRYLRDNYGGYEAHGEIVELVSQNTSIYDAIGMVTGVPFDQLEAEWRASLGAGPPPTVVPLPTISLPTFSFPTPPAGS